MKVAFTLVELLICLGVFTVCIVVFFYSYVLGLNTLYSVEKRREAFLFAQNILEEIKAHPVYSIESDYDDKVFSSSYYEGVSASVDVVTQQAGDPPLYRITVTADWQDKYGRVHQPVKLLTYRTAR